LKQFSMEAVRACGRCDSGSTHQEEDQGHYQDQSE
jgi:hypothetical protein